MLRFCLFVVVSIATVEVVQAAGGYTTGVSTTVYRTPIEIRWEWKPTMPWGRSPPVRSSVEVPGSSGTAQHGGPPPSLTERTTSGRATGRGTRNFCGRVSVPQTSPLPAELKTAWRVFKNGARLGILEASTNSVEFGDDDVCCPRSDDQLDGILRKQEARLVALLRTHVGGDDAAVVTVLTEALAPIHEKRLDLNCSYYNDDVLKIERGIVELVGDNAWQAAKTKKLPGPKLPPGPRRNEPPRLESR